MGEKKEEATILTEPAKAGELSIFVESKIGMPGDKIMVDGEMNEVADDAKDAKDPVVAPPAKKGVEIKLFFPLAAEHAEGKPVKIQVDEKKKEEKKKEEKKKEEKKKEEKKDEKEAATVLTETCRPGEQSIFVAD